MSSQHPPWTPVSEKEKILQTPAKFNIGDRVRWFRVPTKDFGVITDCFYGLEGSVQAEGWHYLIKLDPQSPSFSHCKEDYGFEDDLERVEAGVVDATH